MQYVLVKPTDRSPKQGQEVILLMALRWIIKSVNTVDYFQR